MRLHDDATTPNREQRLESNTDFESVRDEIAEAARFRERKWVRLRLEEVRALSGRTDGAKRKEAELREALEIARDYALSLQR